MLRLVLYNPCLAKTVHLTSSCLVSAQRATYVSPNLAVAFKYFSPGASETICVWAPPLFTTPSSHFAVGVPSSLFATLALNT